VSETSVLSRTRAGTPKETPCKPPLARVILLMTQNGEGKRGELGVDAYVPLDKVFESHRRGIGKVRAQHEVGAQLGR